MEWGSPGPLALTDNLTGVYRHIYNHLLMVLPLFVTLEKYDHLLDAAYDREPTGSKPYAILLPLSGPGT